MADKLWEAFLKTGSPLDYLNYKENEKADNDDNFSEGLSNQGTDYRGE